MGSTEKQCNDCSSVGNKALVCGLPPLMNSETLKCPQDDNANTVALEVLHPKMEQEEDSNACESNPDSNTSLTSTSVFGIHRYKYDFVMWFHEDDSDAADCIYNFLEGNLELKGYRYKRDLTLGGYKLEEEVSAIENSENIFLFITPRSINCGMFENQMNESLLNSITRRRSNVIPIYWELDPKQSPRVVRGIYGISYKDFSEDFQNKIKCIYKKSDLRISASSLNESEASVTKQLNHSQNDTNTKKKKSFLRRLFP